MDSSTVNISFKKDLLAQIDDVAEAESRTRSDLIREAARMYIERRNRWNSIFEYGESQAAELGLSEEDVIAEVRALRRESRTPRA